MHRPSLDSLGQQQRAVIEIIWDLGEATVQDVRDRLNRQGGHKPLAYTTVLSMMQKLEKLGWLTHRAPAKGRSYIYSARHTRRAAGASSLRTFIDRVFRGDPLLLMEHLVDDQALDGKDLAAIRKLLDQKQKEH